MAMSNDEKEIKTANESKPNKYPTIEEQREHFKDFSLLPMIIGILIFLVCLLGGIGMAATMKSAGVFFGWLIGGAIGGALTFAILRILISSQVLTVLYLEKISKQIEGLKGAECEKPTHVAEHVEDKTSVPTDNETPASENSQL